MIENRPAAGGRVAAEFAANQAGDGYTLFIGASGVMSISAAIYPKLAYHPTKSFIPLSMIADFPLIMTSPIDIAPKTVAEVVAYAKANPDKSNYGTTSPAFTISTELLKLKTGMPGVAIPLKSSAEMVLCVIQHNCLISISDGPPAIPQIKEGKVRADRRHRLRALSRASRCAEHGGGGLSRGQHQAVEWLLRAGIDPAGDREETGSRRLRARSAIPMFPRSSRAWRSIRAAVHPTISAR